MNIDRITVTHAATVPTGSYANERIEITLSATITDGDVPDQQMVILADMAQTECQERVRDIKARYSMNG